MYARGVVVRKNNSLIVLSATPFVPPTRQNQTKVSILICGKTKIIKTARGSQMTTKQHTKHSYQVLQIACLDVGSADGIQRNHTSVFGKDERCWRGEVVGHRHLTVDGMRALRKRKRERSLELNFFCGASGLEISG
jgi:hypothetical protein